MRVERKLAWLPVLVLALCSSGMALLARTGHCWGILWLCSRMSPGHDLLTMSNVLLIVLTLLLAWSVRRAVLQLVRTGELVGYLLDVRVPHPASLGELARALGIEDRLDVVDVPEPVAFSYGLFRPRILVTTELVHALTAAECEAVLRHECEHVRRRDPLRVVLWTVFDGLVWWGEGSAAYAELRRELAADRAVMQAQGRAPLAGALFKLLVHPRGGTLMQARLAISQLSVTDARIDQLLRPELPLPAAGLSLRQILLPLATLAAMILCSLLMTRS